MIKYKINSIYYVWCGNMEWNCSNVLEKKYDHSINLPNNYARTGLLNVSYVIYQPFFKNQPQQKKSTIWVVKV